MNFTLPKWAHVLLTLVALAVPWALQTMLPAAGVAVPALVMNLATIVVSLVNSVNAAAGKAGAK